MDRVWAGFRQDLGGSGRTSAGLRQEVGWIWEPMSEIGLICGILHVKQQILEGGWLLAPVLGWCRHGAGTVLARCWHGGWLGGMREAHTNFFRSLDYLDYLDVVLS